MPWPWIFRTIKCILNVAAPTDVLVEQQWIIILSTTVSLPI